MSSLKHSKLSEHKFRKGRFITPWNHLMPEREEASWYLNRLPEYLWIGLILKNYGREEGLKKCYFIIKKLNEIAPNLSKPNISNILRLDDYTQSMFYEYILTIIDKDILSPLTVVLTYSNYPNFAKYFCIPELSIDERIEKINVLMIETSFHQTNLSTDIRFIVLYFALLSGKIIMPKDILDLILQYPKLPHEDEKMREIRPSIRAMELISEHQEMNRDFLKMFWEGISRMSECKLLFLEFSKEEPETQIYMKQIKDVLKFYSDLMVSTNPLDDKMLVLTGIATYSYKRLLELVEHNLFYTITGRSIVRVLIEDYIMMKYLLKNESDHENIWSEFQIYGIGQYKLIVERYREADKDLKDSHVNYEYLDVLVNEYKDEEFIDMDTNYFDKHSIRIKAEIVNEKELFGLYYDYDSAFEHGLWGAIRESSLLKCELPAHQYHCVPDIDNKQNMKSVWPDCVSVMNKTLMLLKKTYGLPDHLIVEGMANGE